MPDIDWNGSFETVHGERAALLGSFKKKGNKVFVVLIGDDDNDRNLVTCDMDGFVKQNRVIRMLRPRGNPTPPGPFSRAAMVA